MGVSAGTRLGPYEILSPIGAGGMGEVYKAKDTRLDRIVAVKILPASMAGNAEVRQRFEREARAISQLSHPHICSLHDVGREGDVDYLVMEYLEGESLADRVTRGPLAVEHVLQFGIQIADALGRAHRQGIVHRDLKPGNVMLTRAGVKLLDFGLAKNLPAAVESEITQLSSQPTRHLEAPPLTEQGTLIGTFQYMSPEQLEGKDADARTDIFALGCVLYEMATGQKAFTGKSRASLIAAVLEKEPPPISSVAPMTPPALDRVVRTCIAKDPDDRFQTAHDVKLQLEWIVEGGSQAGVPAPVAARRRSRERVWVIAAAGLAILSAGLALVVMRNRPDPPRTIATSILPPEKVTFDLQGGPMTLSPDGTRMAFIGVGADGKSHLWIRPLSALSAQSLQGTEGAAFPFWSPDSRFVGFFAGGRLRKIDASGGPPESICDAANGRGGTWAQDGTIVFAPASTGGLSRVPAAGGTPASVTKLEESRNEASHRFPCFLPDGRHFLYLARSTQASGGGGSSAASICVGSIDAGPQTRLLEADSQGLFAEPGYLLFWREGSVLARPFNARKLRFEGDAFPIAENVRHLAGFGLAYQSISTNGLFAYLGGGLAGQSQIAWYDRSGHELEKISSPMDASRPRLSHDGLRLAFDQRDPQSGNVDIWIYEFARKTLTRFTFDPSLDGFAVWSPDDRWIAFASIRKGVGDIYRKSTSGAGAEEILCESKANKFSWSWSSDGRWLLLTALDPAAAAPAIPDVVGYSLSDRRLVPFIQSTFRQGEPSFSPNGHFVAYTSMESGRFEIYAQEFPGHGGKWQISTEGGEDPLWSRDGREIFYIAPGNRLMSVPVKTEPRFEAGSPEFLFEARFRGDTGQQFDVSADGRRFIISADVAELGVTPVTLVQNWLEGKRR